MGFLIPLMLLGLIGLAIPPIIHLLNRRRFQVVDWGAMQFLQVSETTRRRLLIEELLLMLLRMGLIGALVLALAAPYAESAALARFDRGNRDVILVFDGSYSMGFTGGNRTPHEVAKEWAAAFLNGLSAGDSVAVLQAKPQTLTILGPTHDLDRARQAVSELPPPAGGCDWPRAFHTALGILGQSQRPQREIVLLSDGQRFGWADDRTLLSWELLAPQLRDLPGGPPRVWMVNLDPSRPADAPNWSLAPVRASRAIASAGQQVTFRTALQLHGKQTYRPPHRLRVEIDGQAKSDLKPPTAAQLDNGQVPISFTHRFAGAGSHLVSVIVEPDPPPGQRPPGYEIRDYLPGDNRRDFALEVLSALPVLLVDGDNRPAPRHRGTDFLRDALAPARDRTPAVLAKVVPAQEFAPGLLVGHLAEAGTRPRVLVLSNVATLTADQRGAVEQFLANGGGVLVTLGDRVNLPHYNEELYRNGQGWLPARLDEVKGDENRPEEAASPLPSSFFHPALELFRESAAGGLGEARFPRWFAVSTPGRGSVTVPVALLTSHDPWLVERPYRGGRVLLCSVPLDRSWRTNLPDLTAFAPLAHELIYYLAGARSLDFNLEPGQPLRYEPAAEAALDQLSLQPPAGEERPLSLAETGGERSYQAQLLRRPQGPLVVYEGMHETGVYRLKTAEPRTVYYVVQPDERESNLTPCDETDRKKVTAFIPVVYMSDKMDMDSARTTGSERQELWWWVLLGVVVLLCSEVWMTRRLVKARAS